MIRAIGATFVLLLACAASGNAQTGGIEGAWRGGGQVTFGSGAREQASCRAHYTRRTASSYFVRATCATASGRASQTAILRRASQNSYRGRFYNSEYDISGNINVVQRGNTQSVRLTSGSGSAFFQLRR